jgi:hypothetical protein
LAGIKQMPHPASQADRPRLVQGRQQSVDRDPIVGDSPRLEQGFPGPVIQHPVGFQKSA